MNDIRLAAVSLLFCSGMAHAIPSTWELLDQDMRVMGTFSLDIDAQTTSHATISGDLGFYTISSWTFLNSPGHVAGHPVNNFMKFFSAETGRVYRSDFGGGEYHEIRVNDSTIEFGTLAGLLVPGGGLYEAIIHEIYNYDEVSVYCLDYEQVYDPDIEDYVSSGRCAYFGSDAAFNLGIGYWYSGFLRSQPPTAAVPAPASTWLMLLGLGALAALRRQRTTAARSR